MLVKNFKTYLAILLLFSLVSACADKARNHKMTGVRPNGGPTGTNQKAAAGLDQWVEQEKKKADSKYKKSSPEQSTVDMGQTAVDNYKRTTKGKIEEKNKTLQGIMGYVEIMAPKKDDKSLSVTMKVFNKSSKTTRKHLMNFTGEISPTAGSGPLKAEILDDELKRQLATESKPQQPKKNDKQLNKGERFSGDAKCFDLDCYNIMIRVFDNRDSGFVAYLYRVVDVIDHDTDLKARISSDMLKSINESLEKLGRPVLPECNKEKEDCDFKLELSSAKFSFRSAYNISLGTGIYNMKMIITEKSSSGEVKIDGSSLGSISNDDLAEFTVLIKKK